MSTVFYIAMGWLIVIAWNPLSAVVADGGMILLMAGGVLYTLGTVFMYGEGFRSITPSGMYLFLQAVSHISSPY